MKYKNILFDLDGTLTEPKEGICKSVQYALEAFGIKAGLDELEPFIGPPLKDSFMQYYNFTEEQALEAVKKYRERFETVGLYENKLIPGIDKMLEALSEKGYEVAVASSKPQPFVERILEHFDIAEYFNVVVGSGLDGSLYTKAEVVSEALRQLNVKEDADRSATVMVGDRKFDIEGAIANHLHSIGVYFGYAAPGELEAAGAEVIVRTVEELTKELCK